MKTADEYTKDIERQRWMEAPQVLPTPEDGQKLTLENIYLRAKIDGLQEGINQVLRKWEAVFDKQLHDYAKRHFEMSQELQAYREQEEFERLKAERRKQRRMP